MGTLPGANAEVTIQTRTETRDATGSIVTTWPATAYRIRCYIQPNQRQEERLGGAERQRLAGIARFPSYADINTKDRFLWAGHILQVNTVEPAQRVPEIVDFYHVEWEEANNAGL